MDEQKAFESWAVVEVMGHNTFAGRVTEQTIAGQGFIRVDVPEILERTEEYPSYDYEPDGRAKRVMRTRLIAGCSAFTKLLGTGSIYAITPCTEDVAYRVAEQKRARPIDLVDLPSQRAIAAPDAEEETYEEDRDLESVD